MPSAASMNSADRFVFAVRNACTISSSVTTSGVGDGVGEAVGAVDGDGDGVSEAVGEAVALGVSEGDGDGVADSVSDGDADGEVVGVALAEGEAVALAVAEGITGVGVDFQFRRETVTPWESGSRMETETLFPSVTGPVWASKKAKESGLAFRFRKRRSSFHMTAPRVVQRGRQFSRTWKRSVARRVALVPRRP